MLILEATLILFCMAFSYLLGRYIGRKEGEKRALAVLPLLVRKEALLSGKCPICGFLPRESSQEAD